MLTSSETMDSSIPAFITKLWHMVSDPSTDHLICWGQESNSFVIKNEQRFCSQVLPKYYKHNNMSSFIRQLNKYDFHKVISAESLSLKSAIDKTELEFVHPYFIKDQQALLSQIKRKLSNTKELTEFKGDHNVLTKLVKEVQQLQAKQELVESKLIAMKNENDALWREHAIMKQKHQNQQKIVNKLVQFLVSLVRGINIRGGIPLMVKDSIIQPVDGLRAIKVVKARGFGSNLKPTICEVDTNGKQTNPSNGNIAELLANLRSSVTNPSEFTEQTDEHSDFSLFESPKKNLPLTKTGTKRKSSTSSDEKQEAPEPKQPKCNETETADLNINDLTVGFDLNPSQSIPIVTSPSGVIINSPQNDFITDDTSNAAEGMSSPTANTVISDDDLTKIEHLSEIQDTNDMGVHLDGIQTDLNALRDILKDDNLSFDASTIMGLFNSDDNLLLSNPNDEQWPTEDKVAQGISVDDNATELVQYSTPCFNLFDMMGDAIPENAEVPEDLDTSLPELNTPLPSELGIEPLLPVDEYILGFPDTEES